jgi:cysteine desulfurase
MHPLAQSAWVDAVRDYPANPSSPHRPGARADAALTRARETLAEILGCSPFDIIWTSGASESSNTVLHHAASALSPDTEVWVSAIEHPSVLEPARRRFENRMRLVPVNGDGVVDIGWLQSELRTSRPGLVALMAANNETGVLQPWREALAVCRSIGIPFFCDAVQWIGKQPAAGLGECDFVSGSAHKFGGPRGVGFLKCPGGSAIEPMIYGGPQEDGRRAGTENVPGVLSMLAAIEARERMLSGGAAASRETWRMAFEGELVRHVPGTTIIGAGRPRLWNTVAALMPEMESRQRWVVKLDKLGFAVSTGSACSSGKETPSHVLSAMGLQAAGVDRMLRFSSGWESTEQDWQLLAAARTVFEKAT